MTLRHPLRFLVAGLALGWLFDLLFYGKLPGISLLIFSLALLAAVGLALRSEGTQAIRGNLWLPALLLFFAAMGFVRANGFLTFLNICAMLMLASLLAIYLTRRPADRGRRDPAGLGAGAGVRAVAVARRRGRVAGDAR